MYFSDKSAANVPFLFAGFAERAEEGTDHGPDVDWDPCADRRSDWWPVYVIQLVRLPSD